jgi:tRNA pseudouridine55 synthase
MEGILVIDKPIGWTSHDVVNKVRGLSRQRRVGHSGTLDPLATGVLVLCLGRATRLVEYVVGLPKQYHATVRLGQTTDTYDAEGDIVAEAPVDVTDAALDAALVPFRGAIDQVPPIYSAIKKDGQPLYKYARRGETVALEARPVTIYALTRIGRNGDDVQLTVDCSSGTYIRSLAHDLGQALGCGAHLTQLRRTQVGKFSAESAHSLANLTPETLADCLLPPDTAVAHLPQITLTDESAHDLALGRRVPRSADQPSAELARVYTGDGAFLGLARPVGSQWQAHKIFHPAPSTP